MNRPLLARESKAMNVIGLLFGAGFGFVLGAAKLHEYDTIHRTLRLQEPDVFLLMGGAIGVSLPLLWWLERRGIVTPFGGRLSLRRSAIQRHHLIGASLFGTGWALAGTCPAPALVMATSGAWLGLVAVAGLFVGIRLRDRQNTNVAVGDGEHREVVEAGVC
jgi:uncharacterized protein